MTLRALSGADREVIRRCLAAVRGGLLDDGDIATRVGVDPAAFDAVLAAWPAVDDADDGSDAALMINNSLNEVCHGVHVPDAEWARRFTATRDGVRDVYRRWAAARGWDRTGLR